MTKAIEPWQGQHRTMPGRQTTGITLGALVIGLVLGDVPTASALSGSAACEAMQRCGGRRL
jgi:hypothetical protein